MCFPSFFREASGGSGLHCHQTAATITAPWSLSWVSSEKLKLTTLVEREWLMRRTSHTSLLALCIHSKLQTWQHSYLSQELSWNETSDLFWFIPLNPPSSKAVALILFCPAHSYSSKPRPLSPSMSAESSSNVPSRWHTDINIYLDINQSKNTTHYCTIVFDVEAFKHVEKTSTLVLCHTMCPYHTASAQNTQTDHLATVSTV